MYRVENRNGHRIIHLSGKDAAQFRRLDREANRRRDEFLCQTVSGCAVERQGNSAILHIPDSEQRK